MTTKTLAIAIIPATIAQLHQTLIASRFVQVCSVAIAEEIVICFPTKLLIVSKSGINPVETDLTAISSSDASYPTGEEYGF